MKQSDLQGEFAKCLHDLRIRQGLSKAKMSEALHLDERTWAKYESGASAPSAPELVRIFNAFDEDILRPTLDCIYPDKYKDIEARDDVEAMREAASHFFLHVATDNMVRAWNYIAFGQHGSNVAPQLEEFVALDHLPMDYRVAIVKNIVTFYRMAAARDELICPEDAKPDFDILIDAIRKGLEAVGQGRNSYTTATED